MRILFICGSLEAGKDGVGDYTRLLAAELQSAGHYTSIISINDRHIKTDVVEKQYVDDVAIDTYRIASVTEQGRANLQIADIVYDFAPDCISIQFVPFSFDDKGIVKGFASRMRKITGGIPVHLMFHELWGGINNEKTKSFKHTLFFALQKFFILSMLKKLKPQYISTTISAYKNVLPGYKISILPLFSNIPVSGKVKEVTDSAFRILTFGTLSADLVGLRSQLEWLKNIALKENRTPEFIHLGSGGAYKEATLQIAKDLLGNDKVEDAGLLSEADISAYLAGAHAGVSRGDGLLWGKSGTTVAMLEHGLPVVLKGSRGSLITYNNTVINYEKLLHFVDDIEGELKRGDKINALPIISNEMINIVSGKVNKK